MSCGAGGGGGGGTPSRPPGGGAGGGGSSKVGSNNFIMDKSGQSKYPRFTAMVKDLKTMVQNDKAVLDALIKWSGMAKEDILENLTFGEGPTIKIKELESGKYGYFDRSESPDIVNISASWVRGLEAANLESTIKATSFMLAVTLLHELVHQIRAQLNLDRNYEYGLTFEQDAFGVIINRNNAGQNSFRFYGR